MRVTCWTLCPKGAMKRSVTHIVDIITGASEKKLNNYYIDINDYQALSWNQWEQMKQNDGTDTQLVVSKKGRKSDLLKKLVEIEIRNQAQGITFFTHYFNVCWQSLQC